MQLFSSNNSLSKKGSGEKKVGSFRKFRNVFTKGRKSQNASPVSGERPSPGEDSSLQFQ